MKPPENEHSPLQNDRIIVAAFCYFSVNIITYVVVGWLRQMLPAGAISTETIWKVLVFWTYIAPPIAVLLTFTVQIGCRKRPFSWTAFGVFVVAMFIGGYLNFSLIAAM